MKKYIFDKCGNVLYDSIREAERDFGKTSVCIAKSDSVVFLTHEQVEEAVSQYIRSRGPTNASTKQNVRNGKEMATTEKTENSRPSRRKTDKV
jgi:hypothetical protein